MGYLLRSICHKRQLFYMQYSFRHLGAKLWVRDKNVNYLGGRPDVFLLRWLCFQNIIKKVSGQKFVYKFVSQPDPSVAEGARSDEEVPRRDATNPNGGALASACPSKSLSQVRRFSPALLPLHV